MAERRKLDAEYRALVALRANRERVHRGSPPGRTGAHIRVRSRGLGQCQHRWLSSACSRPWKDSTFLETRRTDRSRGRCGTLNQKVLSAEVGLLLGYLARKVLGQYDLTLLGREPLAPGRLYYVEPNITAAEHTLGVPREEFRMWLALHETTHAFEFEAHPWLRDHFNAMLERYFGFLREDAVNLRSQGCVVCVCTSIGAIRERRIRELAGIADERRAARALHADASDDVYRGGYSNHVMNAVGRELLPNYTMISRRFEQRLQQRSQADRLLAKLTGLDVKMEQYRLGEQFIDRVAKERGHSFARRVWDGADYLPTMAEIRQPELWLARIDFMDGRIPCRLRSLPVMVDIRA